MKNIRGQNRYRTYNHFVRQINSQLDDQFGHYPNSQFRNQLWSQLASQFFGQFRGEINNQLLEQLRNITPK